jgi:hypothetical protein
MMWSWTTIPRFAAETIYFVISISGREGSDRQRRDCARARSPWTTARAPLDDLVRIDGRVVDGALLLYLVCDDLVALVEEHDADFGQPLEFTSARPSIKTEPPPDTAQGHPDSVASGKIKQGL